MSICIWWEISVELFGIIGRIRLAEVDDEIFVILLKYIYQIKLEIYTVKLCCFFIFSKF